MSQVESLGIDQRTERELFLLELDRPDELPRRITLSSPNFACLIAWDASNASLPEISGLVESLIRFGGAYYCTWGPDCGRVHDIIDEIDADPYNDIGSPDGSVIMTTDHAKESLREAIWFFLDFSEPDPYYQDDLRSVLAISIGAPEWAKEIRCALKNPAAFRSTFNGR